VRVYKVGLEYSDVWKFEGCEIAIPDQAVRDFYDLVGKIAGDNQNVVEGFTRTFGDSTTSSEYSWALTDLSNLFIKEQVNAALFIDKFWNGICRAKELGASVPNATTVNKILSTHNVPLQIQVTSLIEASAGIIDPSTVSSSTGITLAYTLKEELGRGILGSSLE
jgi:hypothetical protein